MIHTTHAFGAAALLAAACCPPCLGDLTVLSREADPSQPIVFVTARGTPVNDEVLLTGTGAADVALAVDGAPPDMQFSSAASAELHEVFTSSRIAADSTIALENRRDLPFEADSAYSAAHAVENLMFSLSTPARFQITVVGETSGIGFRQLSLYVGNSSGTPNFDIGSSSVSVVSSGNSLIASDLDGEDGVVRGVMQPGTYRFTYQNRRELTGQPATPGATRHGSGRLLVELRVSAAGADFDANGAVNLDDLDIFVAAYFAQEPLADLNGDGAWNLDDIDEFIALFLG